MRHFGGTSCRSVHAAECAALTGEEPLRTDGDGARDTPAGTELLPPDGDGAESSAEEVCTTGC